MSVTVTFTEPKEIVDELMNFKGSSACSMECTTLVKHNVNSRVTGNSWSDTFDGEVYKTYTEHGNIGINYENAVNAQRKREENTDVFKGKSLPWGSWVKDNLVLEHTDKNDVHSYYIRYYSGMNANSGVGESIYHYEDGTELNDAEVEALNGFIAPKKAKSVSQGTEKEIKPKNLKMNGLNKLTVGGKTYIRK